MDFLLLVQHYLIIILIFAYPLLMTSIAEQQNYERKTSFFKQRLQTCAYRFYNLIQIRRKQIPRLSAEDNNQALHLQVQSKVIGSTDTFINCLRGQHYSNEIPEYLTEEANAFKSLVYTRLAPKFVLEEERLKLLEKIYANQ